MRIKAPFRFDKWGQNKRNGRYSFRLVAVQDREGPFFPLGTISYRSEVLWPEVRYSAEGWELREGAEVWSKKPQSWWQVRYDEDGEPLESCYKASFALVHLCRAKKEHRCHDCGQRIEKGEMHGGNFYRHLCLECVTPYPEKLEQFVFSEAARIERGTLS